MANHREAAQPIIDRLVILPAFYRVIVARRKKIVFDWVPFDKFDVLCMATQDGANCELKLKFIALATCQEHLLIVRLVYVNCLVSTASGQVLPRELATQRPVYCLDLVLMVLKLLYALEVQLPCLLVHFLAPNASCTIEAGTGEEGTLRTPAQVPDCFCVALVQRAETLPLFGGSVELPYLDSLVRAGRCEQRYLGCLSDPRLPGQVPHPVLMTLQSVFQVQRIFLTLFLRYF